ncbi:hypothetical protein D7Y21_39445 [Corallococcus sp. AB045]|uniref:hypothetical protein n=1 Tax=Corallococcus sp. AB045 TaxID=2316719 RepID=UPI000EC39CD9|nr:hypothetical protein [Corallococcus sp. AB045]RKH76070.1 hypothetical protein D7Y21_39445 [Corallococcus sp. AB045]
MHRFRAVIAALTLGVPFAASAAEITRIASSFEDDDPFDLFLDVGFERTQTRAKIVREQLRGGDATNVSEVNELWYKGVDARLNLAVAFGLWKDLEFSFKLPIVFQQNETWNFVSGTNQGNSTITNSCYNADGSPYSPEGCVGRLFQVPQESYRGGLGNVHFGLAYAFFNQEKDDTKPTWIVGIDYEAPTAKQRDPSLDNTDPEDPLKDGRGNVGDRVHKYKLYTTFSRKMGVAEPYFKASHTIPVRGPGAYSNCDQSGANPPNLGAPYNCYREPWTRQETGIKAPSQTALTFGMELVPFENAARSQKFALDVRLLGNYVGRGRYYNELSSALRKLLTSDDYFQVGGQVGVIARAAEAFTIRASGNFLYNTDHLLTSEAIGQDLNGDGTVDTAVGSPELNPTFDWRYDLVSRRFRAIQSTTFRFDLGATFSF